MLDTLHTVETPEGVRLVLRPAGPVPRGLAFALDLLLRALGYTAIMIPVGLALADLSAAVFALLLFVGEWFYPVLFEVLGGGRTPGKRAVGLRVVHEDGTPVGWSASILRNLVMAADWLPGTFACGLITSWASPGFRRLGDHAAGTLVVYDAPARLPGETPPDVPPLAPPLPLTVDEQRAVIAYAERAALFSLARADELARSAGPLLSGGEAPSQQLLRMAGWLLGRPGRAGGR